MVAFVIKLAKRVPTDMFAKLGVHYMYLSIKVNKTYSGDQFIQWTQEHDITSRQNDMGYKDTHTYIVHTDH